MNNEIQPQTSILSQSYFGHLYSAGGFLRFELLFLLWSLMEVAILAPLALALMPWARYWPPWQATLWILFIMLVAFNVGRLVNILDLEPNRQKLIILAGLIITILFSWRTILYETSSIVDFGWIGEIVGHFAESGNLFWGRDVAIFVLITVSWWRGLSMVDRRVDVGEAGLRLRAGTLIAAFLVGGLAASQLSYSTTSFILLFFFAALSSIALTRVEQLELDSSGKAFPLGASWLIFVFSAAASVALITGVIAGFVSGNSILNVVGWLVPLWTAVRFLAATVVSTFSYVSLPILLLFGWLVDFLVGLLTPALQSGLESLEITIPAPLATVPPEDVPEVTESIGRTPQQLLTLLVMLVVILMVTLALGRMVRRARRPVESESDRLSPFEGIGQLDRPGLGQRLLQRMGFLRRWQAAASIRAIYREMSQSAASLGYPRIESETPLEYLQTLAKVWPENQMDTRLITEAFTRVRYGEIPETEDELAAIKAAWNRLQSVDLSQAELGASGEEDNQN